ncbi:MAG: calcium/sodium antiporter [Candidatus Marinimicrobia bacterium]|nr:calcium/sodium antiporter [Candidatus Neomarinimicrobiota bacterium]
MFLHSALLIAGLILLVKGADWLVSGATELARKQRVSDLTIGLTIVAFGTSAPELIVNVYSAILDHHDMVFGNILGSNIFNLFMILGLAGLISPLAVQSTTVWKEIPFSLLAVLILMVLTNVAFLSNDPGLSRLDGLILLGFFVGFMLYIYKQLQKDSVKEATTETSLSNTKTWLLILAGLTGLTVGGQILVSNAVALARIMNMSEKLIGLTIVAAGTSLPELATSVVAALKKNNDIAVGNIIGSNIFNIFLILGVSSILRPIAYDHLFNRDMLVLILGTVFLFIAMFTGEKWKLDRWEAGILFAAFLGYMVILIQGAAV